jgi:hypothetical protein
MKFVSEPRCPSNRCLKSFRNNGPLSLLTLPPRPSWLEEIIFYKKANLEHLTDSVYLSYARDDGLEGTVT